MWFNVDKSPKILKQWKSLISPCNLSSRAQKLPKLTQTLGGGIAMYSTFWIGIYGLLSVLISDVSSFNSIFVLFQWQMCLVSDEICLVSSLALSGVSLNGDCMTVNWGSVAMEQRMNGYSVEYGSFFISELNCYPKVPWEVSWLPFSIDTFFLAFVWYNRRYENDRHQLVEKMIKRKKAFLTQGYISR